MVQLSLFLGLVAISQVLAIPAPAPTAAPDLDTRATTCTFSGSGGYLSASKSKTSCSTIVLSALAVPSGVTLDLTGLNKGTKVSISIFNQTIANALRLSSRAKLPLVMSYGEHPIHVFYIYLSHYIFDSKTDFIPGQDLSLPSPGPISVSPNLAEPSSTATAHAGGMVRVPALVASSSPSSSKHTT